MTLFRKLGIAALLFLGFGAAIANQQIINVGSSPNDGTGDPARTAFQKVNANFSDLYSLQYAPLTGPISTTSGSNMTAVGVNVLANLNLAQMPANTIKCNPLSIVGNVQDCTGAQITTLLGTGAAGITSIGLSVPAGFSVVATPCTVSPCTLQMVYAGSQPANQVLATPNGAGGPLGIRALVAADLPNFTGPVTSLAGVTTITPQAVGLTQLAQQPAKTILCNATTGTASPTYCNSTTLATIITGGSGASDPYNIDLCQQTGVDPTGVTDSRAAVVAAFAAAANGVATVNVNCPIFISYGTATTIAGVQAANAGQDSTKIIFIPNGLNLSMGPNGLFIVDPVANVGFMFSGTTNILWNNVNIEYVGHAGANMISQTVGAAATIPGLSLAQLTTYQQNLYTSSGGVLGQKFNGGAAAWNGPSNLEALFLIRGAASNLYFNNLHIMIPQGAPVSDEIFNCVNFQTDYNPGYTGSSGTGIRIGDTPTAANSTIPTGITFDHVVLDGCQMGFVGAAAAHFIAPTFMRYGDLQDGTPGAVTLASIPTTSTTTAVLSTAAYPSGWPYESGTFALTIGLSGSITGGTCTGGGGGTCTITFSGGGVIPVGQQIYVAGMVPTAYNGWDVVTASSAGSVSFVLPSFLSGSTATTYGTIAQIVYVPITHGATSTGTWGFSLIQTAASAVAISGNVGGVAHFSAPPHALYMRSNGINAGYQIAAENGTDLGQFLGNAQRRDVASGTLVSLKFEIADGSHVIGWTTFRPDGCADVLGWDGALTNGIAGGELRNFTCVYDSRILGHDGSQTTGMRILTAFVNSAPGAQAFNDVVIDNVSLFDVNPLPLQMPLLTPLIGFNNSALTNVREFLNDFSASGGSYPSPLISGSNLVETAEIYFNQYTSPTPYRGILNNESQNFGNNENVDVKVSGWHLKPVTWATAPTSSMTAPPGLATGNIVFSAIPAVGASTASLSTSTYPNGWTGATGLYYLTFNNGQSVTAQIATGATAITGYFSSNINSTAITSATATWGPWPYTSCTCMVTLDDSNATQVFVNFTYGSSATTGTFPATTSNPTGQLGVTSVDVYATAAGMMQAYFSNYTSRVTIGNTSGFNNHFHMYDTTNNYEQTIDGDVFTESMTQTWYGTPTGATFTTPINFPSTMAVDKRSLKVTSALDTTTGSLTTFGVGFVGSGHATDLYAAQSPAVNTNPYTNPSTLAAVSNGAQVVLTPTAGTFGTTGTVKVSIRATQTSSPD